MRVFPQSTWTNTVLTHVVTRPFPGVRVLSNLALMGNLHIMIYSRFKVALWQGCFCVNNFVVPKTTIDYIKSWHCSLLALNSKLEYFASWWWWKMWQRLSREVKLKDLQRKEELHNQKRDMELQMKQLIDSFENAGDSQRVEEVRIPGLLFETKFIGQCSWLHPLS